MVTEEQVKEALKAVKYPGYSRDIISFGLIKEVATANGAISVTMQLSAASPEVAAQLKADAEQALRGLPGVQRVHIDVRNTPPAGNTPNPWGNQNTVPGIKHIVAVASGKGGVGKSTASVNIACGLRHLGAKVGLLDCDIYGPSIPLMMGINERPTISADDKLVPPTNYGVHLMSMGFLIEGDAPVIWRGPMIVKTIQQFFFSVAWGELDYLLVDLPPGTGDAQLTLCQTVPLVGGVIITTPQEASLGVVRKGIGMFQKVNVPILGIVENMSYFTAPGGQRVEIFGHGGGQEEARRQNVPFLGEVPIFTEIREGGDKGIPVTISAPESPAGEAFISVARQLRQSLP
ncbi:MAG TPA: Mrp/NBP35 family ATP-binding protein [Verrucomicrobiae bacterium]|nr:Mrp/NBP35 family ATP-binding protein [Verrucomicrobiae bacterium]